MLVFPMDTPGVTLRPIELIDGGFEVNEVFFEDVRVPAENLVGEENQGWTMAKFLLGNERVGIARVGATKRMLAQAKEHAARSRSAAPAGRGPAAWPPGSPRSRTSWWPSSSPRCAWSRNSADGKPHPASSVLKLRGSELQQARHRAAGRHRRAALAGLLRRRRVRRAGLGAGRRRRTT